jgi:hypothetical protein
LEDTGHYFLFLFGRHELRRNESDSVDELIVEQSFVFSVYFRQDIADMLKMRLAVYESASCIKLDKYFEVKVLLALSFDVLVQRT